MENASKALLMAAGVLIGLLVLTSLMFMYNHLKSLPKTQEEILEAEQLVEFNKQYESYNRENLRGTDVISVINKAIDNNKKYDAKDTSDAYYVNVTFILTHELTQKTEMYTYDGKNWNKENEYSSNGISFSAKGYSLNENLEAIKDFIELDDELRYNSKSSSFYSDSDGNQDELAYEDRYTNKKYYITNNVFVEFKRKTFTCTDIHYNEAGRVDSITFQESD